MRFPCWSKAKKRTVSCWVIALICWLTAAGGGTQVTANNGQTNSQTQITMLPPNGQQAVFDLRMHVVSSVPLPDFWKKMGNSDRVGCSKDGDLLFELMPGELGDLSHQIARVGVNGAMLGYFDLRQTPGFEKATIQQATFDSAGRIVLLVRNLLATDVLRTDAEGRPHGMRFRMDRTLWVLTVDDNGKILSKFSFDRRVVAGQHLALFKNRNVLVAGFVQQMQPGEPVWTAGAIFSPDGTVLANLRVPAPEDQPSATSNERSPAPTAMPVRPTGPAAGGEAAAAALGRPSMVPRILVPFANGDDEIFLTEMGEERFLLKVSADGTVAPKVKLALPEDQRAYIERIDGHRALAGIMSAHRPPPGTITKTPEWRPQAVFDTESGALLETLLVSMHEDPVCYSGSGMKGIRVPEGTLDTLEK